MPVTRSKFNNEYNSEKSRNISVCAFDAAQPLSEVNTKRIQKELISKYAGVS